MSSGDTEEAIQRPAEQPDTEALRVAWHEGDRAVLRPLFEAAESSVEQLNGYIDAGRVLVAWRGSQPVGHLQVVAADEPAEIELKNMAVRSDLRVIGLGRRLVEAAVRRCADEGYRRMVVATAAADAGNLRFYQRCGFRFLSVERDAFTPATGYPEPIYIDGVLLRDRVWLDRSLA
jgi:GNAT superfamily N-acetyltransferase